jgi:glutathione S-transferase
MSELILYSYRRCPFAIRVRMVLEEKQLAYRVHEENLRSKSAELLAMHPQGKVPLLVHGNLVLYESSIITEYLEEAFPSPALVPTNPKGRAEMRLWTYWCNMLFKPDLDAFKYQWKAYNKEEKEALTERLTLHLKHLTLPLLNAPFILGQEFTLADIHLFPFYRQLKKANLEFSTLFQCEKLDDWLDRLTARPSFQRVMQKASL